MTKFFSLLLLPLFLLSGCSLEDQLERREDRLIGRWTIDRAFFKNDRDLFRDNITADFRGALITFYEDYTLEYTTADGTNYSGNWLLSALRNNNNNNNNDDGETEFLLDADFYGPDNTIAFQWLGEIQRLDRNNFNLRLQERNGETILYWDRR